MNSTPAGTAGPAGARVALMYHALTGTGSPIEGQDRHYSVSSEQFDAHVALLRERGRGGISARDWLGGDGDGTLLTFDDGHVSNYALAFPLLVERGASADFFVNPGRVGSSGFADWAQLREMADGGMSIQSHGWDHRYFTELTPAELHQDLLRSRLAIEDAIGRPVRLLTPPGGRMPAGLVAAARAAGYEHVLGSQPGTIDARDASLLPRMAVTAGLNDRTLGQWLNGDGIAGARARYAVLGFAKRALGNRTYERVRRGLLGQSRSDA